MINIVHLVSYNINYAPNEFIQSLFVGSNLEPLVILYMKHNFNIFII